MEEQQLITKYNQYKEYTSRAHLTKKAMLKFRVKELSSFFTYLTFNMKSFGNESISFHLAHSHISIHTVLENNHYCVVQGTKYCVNILCNQDKCKVYFTICSQFPLTIILLAAFPLMWLLEGIKDTNEKICHQLHWLFHQFLDKHYFIRENYRNELPLFVVCCLYSEADLQIT